MKFTSIFFTASESILSKDINRLGQHQITSSLLEYFSMRVRDFPTRIKLPQPCHFRGELHF